MAPLPDHKKRLPIKNSLIPIFTATIITAVMMTALSVAGLVAGSMIYPTEEQLQTFVPNDVVNLVVGLPILVVSLWWARRGKLVGLLCWPGALIFVLYNYLAYTFGSQPSWAFLGYLSLVVLSLYTVAGLFASMDMAAIKQRLAGRFPEKLSGGVMVAFGVLFLGRVFLVFGGSIGGETELALGEYVSGISDFFISPAMLIGGVQLWRGKDFGYAAGLGLLFQASMLFIGLIVFLLLQPALTGAEFAPVDVIVVAVMGVVCSIPFGLYLRAATRAA
jgi:hypothetical protein